MRKRRCVTRFTALALAGLLVFGTPAEALAAEQPEFIEEEGRAAAENPEELKESDPAKDPEAAENENPEEPKETPEETEAVKNENPEEPKETPGETESGKNPEAAENENPEEPKETPGETEPAKEPKAAENENSEEPKETPEETEPSGNTEPAENPEETEPTGDAMAAEDSKTPEDTESGTETETTENPEDTAEMLLETVENTELKKDLGGATDEENSDGGYLTYKLDGGYYIHYKVLDETEKTIEITEFHENGNLGEIEPDGRLVIPEKINGYKVISIGDHALSYCRDVTNVEIPGSVTSIGNDAFAYNPLYDGMNFYVEAGSYAETWVKNKGEIIIIGKMSEIKTSDEGLAYVLNEAESTIKIVKYKGYGGAKVVIPETIDGYKVTGIEKYAFYNCWRSARIRVAIPGSVTSIESDAFPDNDRMILCVESGSYAEKWAADNGRSVVVGKMPELKYSPEGFAYEVLGSEYGIEILGYTGSDTEVVIPETIDGYKVKGIGREVFSYCRSLISIKIPGSMTSIGDRAFICCSSLTSVEIPGSVTGIGEEAFSGCGSLTSVKIQNGVKGIGRGAFSNCSLTSVEIPESVISIGKFAFMGCSSLTSIEIPGSVTSIGDYAFECCNDDMIFYVEPGSYAEKWATDNGRRVVTGKMPALETSGGFVYKVLDEAEGVIEIVEYINIFDTSISIPETIDGYSVGSIGNEAFSGGGLVGGGLTCIVIPPSVTGIGERAFYNCPGLRSVEIPASVTGIGKDAFPDDSSMIFYVESGSYAERWATDNGRKVVIGNVSAEFLTYKVLDETEKTIEITGCDEERYLDNIELPKNMVIPDEIDGYKVISIKDHAFSNCGRLRSVVIPASVTSIEDYAFFYCDTLSNVEIPASVTSIGNDAFVYDPLLDDGMSFYVEPGSYAETWAKNKGEIVIIGKISEIKTSDEGLSYVLNKAESTIKIVKYKGKGYGHDDAKVVIPETIDGYKVTGIEKYAFYDCWGSARIRVAIPGSVTSIESDAFPDNDRMILCVESGSYAEKWAADNGRSVVVGKMPELKYSPEGFAYEVLGSEYGIEILGYTGSDTEVVIPETIDGCKVKGIGREVFSYCRSLISIKIPGSMTSIGDRAFICCSSLTSVEIPGSVTGIGKEAFSGCGSLTSVKIQNGVKGIGIRAFSNCSSLTSVEIPESVISIGKFAFMGCSSLTSVKIPESVTSIGDYAFECCNDDMIFYVEPGSYAEKWAMDGGRKVVAGNTPAIIDISGCTIALSETSVCYTGAEIRPDVTVKDGDAVLEKGADYTVSYEDNVNAGTATVTVTGKGNYTGSKEATFTITAKSVSGLTVAKIEDQSYTGATITPAVTVEDGDRTLKSGTDYTLSYANNTNAGKAATVTITGKGNYVGSKAATFTITAKSVSGLTVAVKSQSYTGSAVKPAVTVTDGKKTLKNGTDYTLTYTNNVNAGKAAAVTITGKGNYAGSKKVTFTITAKSVSGLTVSAIGSQFYTGKSITPAVTVKDGKKTLKKGTDYTVSYANNKKTGKATVTVAGKGNYAGSKKVTFTILPNVTGVKAVSADYSSVKISWKKVTGVTGYKVYRADSKNGKYTCIKTIKGAGTVSYKDGKLTTGKTYYYKVRAYVSGQDGSLTGAVSAKPALASASLSSVSNTGAKTATVKWKQVSGASGYEVYSATAKNGKYKKITMVKKTGTVSYKDTKLKKGSTYYYKVRAYRTVNGKKVYGGYSAVKNVKIKK